MKVRFPDVAMLFVTPFVTSDARLLDPPTKLVEMKNGWFGTSNENV